MTQLFDSIVCLGGGLAWTRESLVSLMFSIHTLSLCYAMLLTSLPFVLGCYSRTDDDMRIMEEKAMIKKLRLIQAANVVPRQTIRQTELIRHGVTIAKLPSAALPDPEKASTSRLRRAL